MQDSQLIDRVAGESRSRLKLSTASHIQIFGHLAISGRLDHRQLPAVTQVLAPVWTKSKSSRRHGSHCCEAEEHAHHHRASCAPLEASHCDIPRYRNLPFLDLVPSQGSRASRTGSGPFLLHI